MLHKLTLGSSCCNIPSTSWTESELRMESEGFQQGKIPKENDMIQ